MDPQVIQRTEFGTAGGVRVTRTAEPFDLAVLDDITQQIDDRRGGVLSSGMEYPGRYSRWHTAYVDPCAEIVARGRRITVRALNDRGLVLLPVLSGALARAGEPGARARRAGGGRSSPSRPGWSPRRTAAAGRPCSPRSARSSRRSPATTRTSACTARSATTWPSSSSRSGSAPTARPASVTWCCTCRTSCTCWTASASSPPCTGMSSRPAAAARWGCPGPRPARRPGAMRRALAFGTMGTGRSRGGTRASCSRPRSGSRGVTCSRWCRATCSVAGATRPPRSMNNSGTETRRPMSFSSTWGKRSAWSAPRRRCTCGSAGTGWRPARSPALSGVAPTPWATRRTSATLLNSAKDESELTMCTDVDRNDKSRVCVPGSVRVIGRRQIEMYSRLIHTVDHIEGRLRPGLDALDAFLTHMWAVTVTGAPKTWAMQFIEDHEGGPRRWYGGAVGMIGFDGSMNTGLTLRTAHITGGVAAVRAGATLLFESDPMAEERETELKARALLETLAEAQRPRLGGRAAGLDDCPGRPARAGAAGAAGGPPGLVRAHAGRLLPGARRRGADAARRAARRGHRRVRAGPGRAVTRAGPGRLRLRRAAGCAGRSAGWPCSGSASGCRPWSSTRAAS